MNNGTVNGSTQKKDLGLLPWMVEMMYLFIFLQSSQVVTKAWMKVKE